MRKESLRQYVMLLLASGEAPVAAFSRDLTEVVGEISGAVVAQGSRRIGDAVLGKLHDIVGDVRERGIFGMLRDLQALYNRGATANAQRRK